jgi:putative ABC transport system ATP-binding protein
MHILAALDRPTSGQVLLEGKDTAGLSANKLADIRNQHFSFVFQQFYLQPRMSVLDNVTLQLRIRGMSPRARRRQAMTALERVGLADKAGNRATDLSGGQKQRVAVARALVAKPRVLFADEPTGNLDSATGAAIQQLLFEVNREAGMTVVVVTHDPDLAASCDRTIEVADGLIADDRLADDRFTAVGGPR